MSGVTEALLQPYPTCTALVFNKSMATRPTPHPVLQSCMISPLLLEPYSTTLDKKIHILAVLKEKYEAKGVSVSPTLKNLFGKLHKLGRFPMAPVWEAGRCEHLQTTHGRNLTTFF